MEVQKKAKVKGHGDKVAKRAIMEVKTPPYSRVTM